MITPSGLLTPNQMIGNKLIHSLGLGDKVNQCRKSRYQYSVSSNQSANNKQEHYHSRSSTDNRQQTGNPVVTIMVFLDMSPGSAGSVPL